MKELSRTKFIKGAIIISIFAIISKVIGALFKIGLSNIVGSDGMGIYQLLFPLFVFCVILSSDGFSLGLSVFVAKTRDSDKSGSFKKYAVRLVLGFSVISAIFVASFSNFISSILGGAVASFLYIEVAIGIVVVSLLSYAKAIVRGYEDFKIYSISEIIEQFVKVALALGLAFFLVQYGKEYAIAGVFAGIIISSITSLLFLLIQRRSYFKFSTIPLISESEQKDFFKFSIGSTLSALIIPLIQIIDSVLVINLLNSAGHSPEFSTSLFGLSRGSVSAIINLPSFFLVPFEFLLLPNISRSTGELYDKKTSLSLMLSLFVSIPFVIFFNLFSVELIGILYGGALTSSEIIISSNLLRLGSLSIVFTSLSSIIQIFLEANKKIRVPIISGIVGGLSKIIFLFIFVPRISIYGAELSSVLFSIVECLVNFVFAFKYKLFSRPRSVLPLLLVWIIFFGVVYIAYFSLKVILSKFLAFVVAFLITLLIVAVISFTVYRKKKDTIKNIFKRFLS